VITVARSHTTVAVERATLRLGRHQPAADPGHRSGDVPWVNRVGEHVRDHCGLDHGATLPVFHALREHNLATPHRPGRSHRRGPDPPNNDPHRPATRTAPTDRPAPPSQGGSARSTGTGRAATSSSRPSVTRRAGRGFYLIVATRRPSTRTWWQAAERRPRRGRRDRGDPLHRPVPFGLRPGGRDASRVRRAPTPRRRTSASCGPALDDVSHELGRYVRLTNYASGLCMPEIAVLGGLERLDMMLNDSMYGILFRDINPIRTFCDQRFSRQVHGRAGIIINPGEDNYLTTARRRGRRAHRHRCPSFSTNVSPTKRACRTSCWVWGNAFRDQPEVPESFRLELAHALLARELFPDAPLKWMPPTKGRQ